MAGEILIRKVELEDVGQLQQLSRETFYDTYKDLNTPENMQYHLLHHYSVETLTNEIKSSDSEFYFATLNAKAVGYIKVNFGRSQTESVEGNGLELERIYVDKDFQNHHIGKLLLEKAVEIGHEHKKDFLWLGVFTLNPRAVRFYENNGFVKFGTHTYTVGADDQLDFLMKFDLH